MTLNLTLKKHWHKKKQHNKWLNLCTPVKIRNPSVSRNLQPVSSVAFHGSMVHGKVDT